MCIDINNILSADALKCRLLKKLKLEQYLYICVYTCVYMYICSL